MPPTQYILALIAKFPCLAKKVQIKGCTSIERGEEHFDPDRFMAQFRGASPGEILCARFVVNVWNPNYADDQGWTFDFFDFAGTADPSNRRPVLEWMANPYWP